MVYIFIKPENNAASLYIINTKIAKSFQWITTNVTEKNPSWEANSCSVSHSIPCLYRTRHFITTFTSPTHTLSTYLFRPLIFCTHTFSSLKNNAITAHMFTALRTPWWHTKMLEKKKWHSDK
jgi:hypothetical protein